MKLSPNWIRDYVDLTVDDGRLAQDLTDVGLGVEGKSGSGSDLIFEMEIGTNRPDAMNHYGVAREAAAIYDRPLKQIAPKLPAVTPSAAFPITVEEPALCPRFSARVIRGTHIKPSPEKIAHRLQLLDQRPISNAVMLRITFSGKSASRRTSSMPTSSRAVRSSCARLATAKRSRRSMASNAS